eukprot:27063-Pyramimonas_sp.AAC.1
MFSLSPPRRHLIAACRLGLSLGLAAMFPPSPPRHRVVAARRLGLCRSGGYDGAAAAAPSPP